MNIATTTSSTFKSGLNYTIKSEISNVKPYKVESHFAKLGINTDFAQNKFLSWAALKSVNIIDQLNKNFNLNLCVPRGIFVEDFELLNLPDETENNAFGLSNFFKSALHKNSSELTDGLSLVFNKNVNWNNIDLIADEQYELKQTPTSYFLNIVLHEFMHIIHEGNILQNITPLEMLNFLIKTQEPKNIQLMQEKYSANISKICDYALSNPIETVACDLTKKFCNNINQENCDISGNPFMKISNTNFDRFLKNLWNGFFVT